ncbi:hypothetical protein F4827_005767 [Paraburkholderia bannensis]|uniref:Uncharacterized protein n=1 Tax=Paraburkholderia bannensis TaxID=765414 RepID=A0A7W9WW07_9BURK|nr:MULTISPECIES: hypothetical protein [Paraburkholderia]MBB3260727.1 hypothetical protein [Paraburkholderia sp. WP4_3_2]MBB6105897.1 hypothetical protein [Paraburkholderia bannensis]
MSPRDGRRSSGPWQAAGSLGLVASIRKAALLVAFCREGILSVFTLLAGRARRVSGDDDRGLRKNFLSICSHYTFETDIPVPPLENTHDGFIEFHVMPNRKIEAAWVKFPTTPKIPGAPH